jgi:hypothetical protein
MVQPGTVVADTGFAEVREAGRQNPEAAGQRGRVGVVFLFANVFL